MTQLVAPIAGASSLLFLQFSAPQISHQDFPNLPVLTNLLSSPALASSRRITYIPPNNGSPRRTTSNASRGCDNLSHLSLYLLAPRDRVGTTASDRPTLAWYISRVPDVPVEFALVEEGVPTPLWKQKIEVQKAGIATISLPENSPHLVEGREYKWSIRLICNPVSPSAAPPYISWMRKVPLPEALRSRLSTATSNRDRAFLYAQAGMWYDAVAATVNQFSDRSASQSEVMADLRSLLSQAGLPPLANSNDMK
ncbi:DUF928 domain-containing protein [Pseudanabaena sp. PCC 6802]|uniref:DUF928 domain-containing protein n=1 Tax=Pseudanabaena sp. PCC 6802 TaxID=118173 RepID=UPI000344E21E|nr:DUF928 domain-containing protein [Pseudanabaena sp. PCC 6802]